MTLTLEDLDTITLNHGAHYSPGAGHCLLEVVSMFAGEAFSDSPGCVDPVLRSFGISWNDGMRSNEERAQLKQYIARLVGTNKGPELSQKRGWMAMDWLVRVHCATWLALNPGLSHHAETLRALPPVTCVENLLDAQPMLDLARAAAGAAAGAAARVAAWDAARVAARDAAWDAARDAAGAAARVAAGAAARVAAGAAAGAAARVAAGDAAGDAARVAAWDAARVAARVAAGAAARVAAWEKLEPTVLALQTSAHELFSRMIDAE